MTKYPILSSIEDPAFVLGIGAGVLVVLGLFVWQIAKAIPQLGARVKEMYRHYLNAAHQLGMQFQPSVEEDDSIIGRLGQFKFTRRAKNMCSSWLCGSFIHQDRTWHGSFVNYISKMRETEGGGSRSVSQTVLLLETESASIGAFSIAPEGILQKAAASLGAQDIDFRDYPEFSRNYTLKASNELAVRRDFSPHVISLFEANPGLSVESMGRGSFIIYRAGNVLGVGEEGNATLAEAYGDMLRIGLELGGLLARR